MNFKKWVKSIQAAAYNGARTVSVYFSIFNDTIDQNNNFEIAKLQIDFFGVADDFIIKKLKSKHTVCFSFLWRQVFSRERKKIFHTYSEPYSPKYLVHINNYLSKSYLSKFYVLKEELLAFLHRKERQKKVCRFLLA